MRKGIIVNLKRIKLLDFITVNHIFILMCAIFIAGVAVGSVIYPENKTVSELTIGYFESYIKYHGSVSFISKILFSFLTYLIVLLLLFLSGTSMLGLVVVPFITCWQGIIFGNLTSFLYSEYALKGIAFNAIILVPSCLIFSVCSFFAARESINFSLLLARLSLPRTKPANIYIDFKKYSGKYLLFVAVCLLAAIVDILLSAFFLHFFEF